MNDTLLEKAVARPWRIDGKDHRWLAENDEGQYVYFDDPANAELIVKAVNAYEPLVKVVNRLVKWGTNPELPGDAYPPITPEGFDVLRSIIRDAAALATVESPEREGGE